MRPTVDYADAHLPGALAIPLRGVFATWLGWLLPDPGTPIVIVRNPDQDPEEIVWQARKVGYAGVVGELDGGVTAWAAAGEPVTSTPLADPATVDPARVVDVRQHSEFVTGHLPGAVNVELGAVGSVPVTEGPLVTMCGHSERAATAASVLERAGRAGLRIMPCGPDEWAQASGEKVTVGG